MRPAQSFKPSSPTPVDGMQRAVDVGEAQCLHLQHDGLARMQPWQASAEEHTVHGSGKGAARQYGLHKIPQCHQNASQAWARWEYSSRE